MHVRKGDPVVVIAGKDKGKRGKVLRVLNKVESRGRRARGDGQAPHQADAEEPAGRHHREGGLGPHLERVLLYDEKTNRGTRTKIKTDGTARSASA